MTTVRPAAVAGQFYPGNPAELGGTINRFLAQADASHIQVGEPPKALIVPHAGYVFSGACAARAYATIAKVADKISRVILMGPCHRAAIHGLATTSADAWETPLGQVEIDQRAIATLTNLDQVSVNDAAHQWEHSLEVHLPFLQRVLPNFRLVPFAVGNASNVDVAEVLETLWGGEETLIVISTDLSHYLSYEDARTIDNRTATAIEKLDWQAISQEQACGRVPVSGLLTCAKKHGLAIERVGFCNSGDTAGPRDRVVGYGSWILH
ncbi:AmmeMemoRadiSam system protein B [Aestuariispira ectoiniformans]|uniref:AmmeMemoRadiSam system protein B n=1 Tax=Aestuariispira ectoiniformans TaxID=2775080 RepID=UPI00223BE978|nr:AmmeMemoRadiSam system protein B [Aestuariispira ectoiniformans]